MSQSIESRVISARRAAFNMLLAVEKGGYANLVVKEQLPERMSPDERSFATALFYTTLDHLLYLDFIIDSFAKGRLQTPVRGVLRLGVCQLLYMSVPESAACNESVKLVKQIGKDALAGFVNGTLRVIARSTDNLPRPQGTRAQVLSITHSWPLWIVEEWMKRFGEIEAEAMLSFQAEPVLTLRENPYRAKSGEVEDCLRQRGIAFTHGTFASQALRVSDSFNIASDPLFEQGKVAVQGESSVFVCSVADVVSGMHVLDACAAPGGKSLCMAANMKDGQAAEGEIVAWDIHSHRVELIQKNCERLGVGIVHAAQQDAAQFVEKYKESFDVVLVDAPCSGLGVVGGKPDVKYSKSANDIVQLAALQRTILSACAGYVKHGGALVYATCTISKAENEDNIDWFLREFSDFSLCDLSPYLPDGFDKSRLAGGGLQMLPHRDGVDGFFVCRMVRR